LLWEFSLQMEKNAIVPGKWFSLDVWNGRRMWGIRCGKGGTIFLSNREENVCLKKFLLNCGKRRKKGIGEEEGKKGKGKEGVCSVQKGEEKNSEIFLNSIFLSLFWKILVEGKCFKGGCPHNFLFFFFFFSPSKEGKDSLTRKKNFWGILSFSSFFK